MRPETNEPAQARNLKKGQGNSPSSGFPIDKRTQNLQQIQDLVSLGNCRPCPLPVLPQRVAKLPATASEIRKFGRGFWFQVVKIRLAQHFLVTMIDNVLYYRLFALKYPSFIEVRVWSGHFEIQTQPGNRDHPQDHLQVIFEMLASRKLLYSYPPSSSYKLVYKPH